MAGVPQLNYAKQGLGTDIGQMTDTLQKMDYNRAIAQQMQQEMQMKQQQMQINEQHQGVSNYIGSQKQYLDRLIKGGNQELIDQAIGQMKGYLGQHYPLVSGDYDGIKYSADKQAFTNLLTVQPGHESLLSANLGYPVKPGDKYIMEQTVDGTQKYYGQGSPEMIQYELEKGKVGLQKAETEYYLGKKGQPTPASSKRIIVKNDKSSTGYAYADNNGNALINENGEIVEAPPKNTSGWGSMLEGNQGQPNIKSIKLIKKGNQGVHG